MDGITPIDIMNSLRSSKNYKKIFKAGEGAGRSGSFFFFSHDDRFIIKTMTKSEKDRFLKLIDSYILHLEKSENKSLLARIYGIFTFKSNIFPPLEIMIMQNTVRPTHMNTNLMKFDLKGSSIARYTNLGEDHQFWKASMKPEKDKILKDIHF